MRFSGIITSYIYLYIIYFYFETYIYNYFENILRLHMYNHMYKEIHAQYFYFEFLLLLVMLHEPSFLFFIQLLSMLNSQVLCEWTAWNSIKLIFNCFRFEYHW